MADAKRTVELVFEATNKTDAAINAVIGNTEKFAGNVQSATQPIANFTESALKLEATMLASGAALTAFAVKLAGDFDGAFREIATLIDEPIEALAGFKQAILDYAETSTQPLDQVTQAIYSSISAGVEYSEAIEAVAQAEKLAVAGKAGLNESTIALVSSLNAYGLGMDSAERFSDALFTTVKQGQTTLPELNAGLAQVTGTAATLEVPFETLLAAIATLTKSGTPTAQAITQVSAVLSGLLKPSSGAAAEAERLGIEFSAQAVKAKGLETVLEDIRKATGGNEAEMAKLFPRVEALRAIFPLTGKAAQEFSDILGAMQSKTGATSAAFEKMAGAFGLQSQKIVNALEAMFIQFGSPILDDFGGVAEAISGIFSAIGDSADTGAIRELVAFVESEMQGLSETLRQVGQNLPDALNEADLSGFTEGVKAVSDALGILFDGFDLTTTEGLAKAITAVAKGFEGLSRFTGGVITSLKPLFDQVTSLATKMTELDSGVADTVGQFFGFATQANKLAGGLNALLPAIEALLTLLIIKQAGGLVGGLTSASGGVTKLAGVLGKSGLVGAAGAAGFALGTLANKAVEVATGNSLSAWALDAAEALGLLPTYSDDAAESLEKLPRTLQTFDQVSESSEERIRNIAQSLKDAGDAGNETSVDWGNLIRRQNELRESGDKLVPMYDLTTGKINGFAEGLLDAANSADRLDQSGRGVGGTLSFVKNESAGAAAATTKLADAALKTEGVFVALIQSSADVAIAQIQADAEKAVAAFDAVSDSIQSTDETLRSLFDNFNEAGSIRDKFKIEEQIKLENENKQRDLERLERLTEAQIRKMDADRKRLDKGGAFITVNGDGLKPHLEAFMFEIFSALQVQINAEGRELLLGL